MRKGMWGATAAGLVVVLSGAGGLGGGARVLAADSRVTIGGDTESDINKWGYTPKELTVPAGTTVAWHNGGQQAHTVTADDGKSFSSPSVAPGGDFQFAFPSAGDYAYHCEPHPWMKAVVHVVGGGTPTPAATTAPTQPAPAGTPATTATTAKPGAAKAAAASPDQPTASTTPASAPGSNTTTTATTAQAAGSTTTTLASAAAPTGAPESASSTTTTTSPKEEAAEIRHKHRGHTKSSPVGITFAAVSTLLLTAVAAKLLASKP